jgi:hypothetical protein
VTRTSVRAAIAGLLQTTGRDAALAQQCCSGRGSGLFSYLVADALARISIRILRSVHKLEQARDVVNKKFLAKFAIS